MSVKRSNVFVNVDVEGKSVAQRMIPNVTMDFEGSSRSEVKRRPKPQFRMTIAGSQLTTTTTTAALSAGSRLSAPVDEATAAAVRNYRRSSLAATLHANLIGLGAHPDAFDVARRRLSNVSDVVSRKISRTIGWRSLSVSVELTVSQGTSLCAQYMRSRLKRSGIFQRKLGLKRMRSAKLLSGGQVVDEVHPTLAAVGAELEKMHPQLFERIARQVGCGSFTTEQRCNEALTDVAREMLRAGECNWAKIVALYAVAGGMAVDCVRQGKPEFLVAIQRAMTVVLEEDLAVWIQANGGWSALALRYRPLPKQIEWQASMLTLFIIVVTIVFAVLVWLIKKFLL